MRLASTLPAIVRPSALAAVPLAAVPGDLLAVRKRVAQVRCVLQAGVLSKQ